MFSGSPVERALRYVAQKSVLRKMACAPSKALVREAGSERSPWTIVAPRDWRARAAVDKGERVIQRTSQVPKERKVRATEPPWFPVAPMTTIVFFGWAIMLAVKREVLFKVKVERE